MRRPRLKLDASKEAAFYHCISRTAGAQWLLKDTDKEVLRKQLWALAEYCGLQVVTYALMSNHYHILVMVPVRRELSDAELLKRYRALYTNMTTQQRKYLAEVEADMKINGEMAQRWRRRQLAQMFDISRFNKLLKMRFSIWYNKTHKRIGTLWAERFKSVLVEDGAALRMMAAYIDLNCVRAKMVSDPKDYRFCGYAEAVAGRNKAREGLELVCGRASTMQDYRCLLFGALSDDGGQEAGIEPGKWDEVVKMKGKLPLRTVMLSRIRYFVDGGILGSEAYVQEKAANLVGRTDRKPRPLAAVTEWAGLHVLSGMRRNLWG